MTAPLKLTTSMPQNVMIDAINQNFRQIEGESRRKVVTDEDGKDRIIIGKKEDGSYAIKVSADGYDVNTASDDQLVMNSDWNMWKIIASGSMFMNPSLTRRSGTVTLDSSHIGYVSDIFIPIRNLTNPNYTNFSNRLQIFVRDVQSKKDMNFSGILYHDGTNWATINYSYLLVGKYLLVRTAIRWMNGSVVITPQSQGNYNTNIYWEIANPTRFIPGGIGAAGTPTGQYVYCDSVTVNPYANDLSGTIAFTSTRTTIPSGGISTLYSYTYQFMSNADGYRFPLDTSNYPIPAVDIDN